MDFDSPPRIWLLIPTYRLTILGSLNLRRFRSSFGRRIAVSGVHHAARPSTAPCSTTAAGTATVSGSEGWLRLPPVEFLRRAP